MIPDTVARFTSMSTDVVLSLHVIMSDGPGCDHGAALATSFFLWWPSAVTLGSLNSFPLRLDADAVGAECLGVLTKAGIVQPGFDGHPRSPPGLSGSSARDPITKR